MQPGQILVNKDGGKRKILGVCGEIYFVSQKDSYQYCYGYNTEKNLKMMAGLPSKNREKPTLSEPYWYVNEDGNFEKTNWGIDGMESMISAILSEMFTRILVEQHFTNRS